MTYAFMIILLSILALRDLRTSRIPNMWILAMFMVIGICYLLESHTVVIFWKSILLSMVISALLYRYRVLGAADLKILIAISPFFNESSLIFILLFSMLLFTLVMLAVKRLDLIKALKSFSVGIVDDLSASPFTWAYIIPVCLCCIKIIQSANG